MPLYTTQDPAHRAADAADRIEGALYGHIDGRDLDDIWVETFRGILREQIDFDEMPTCTCPGCEYFEKNDRVCGPLEDTGNYFCFGCCTTLNLK